MASQWPPKKGEAFTLYFTLFKNDGTIIANPGTITKKVSIDGGAIADLSNTVTEEDTTYGQCSLVFSTSEMNGDAIWYYIVDDTSGCVPCVGVIYTSPATGVPVDVTAISGDSTAADNLEADYDGTGYAKTNSTTKLHADYDAAKTAAAAGAAMTLTSAYDAAKSAAAAGAKMDLVDAPNATAVTAIQSGLATATALDAVDDFVDTEVGAIKAVTDKLDTALELDSTVYRFTTNALEQAPTGGSAPTAAAIADAVCDEALSGHTTAGSVGKALADILADTNELQTNQGNWATATGFSTHSAADVKTAIEAAGSHLPLIKAKPDNLPANPAAVGSAMTLHADYDAAKTAAQAGDEMDLVDAPNVTAVAAIQSGLSTLSAGDVADAVWDESTASHTSSGTFGRLLNLLRRLLFNRQVDSGNSVENFDDDGETSLGTASWSESTGTRGKHTVAW